MNGINAFIDEYGSYGFDFTKLNNSTHFIISAVLVKNENLEIVKESAEKIRKKFFQTGEMKSKSIGSNHKRRKLILTEIMRLPLKVIILVVNKKKIYSDSGIKYKGTFYKFLNEKLYEELCTLYSNIEIYADQVGTNEYTQSFIQYIQEKRKQLSLFDNQSIKCVDSKISPIVQIADVISGSLAYCYDEHKMNSANGNNYKKILSNIILNISEFPRRFEDIFKKKEIKNDFDYKVMEICHREAENFIQKNASSKDPDIKKQIHVVKYLLFRFINNSFRKYISTTELINSLESAGFPKMTSRVFRTNIIAKLRDAGVIIASSKSGLKIPSKVEEVVDFIEHGENIVFPMLQRMKRCCSIIKASTLGELDLLQINGNEKLKNILDYVGV